MRESLLYLINLLLILQLGVIVILPIIYLLLQIALLGEVVKGGNNKSIMIKTTSWKRITSVVLIIVFADALLFVLAYGFIFVDQGIKPGLEVILLGITFFGPIIVSLFLFVFPTGKWFSENSVPIFIIKKNIDEQTEVNLYYSSLEKFLSDLRSIEHEPDLLSLRENARNLIEKFPVGGDHRIILELVQLIIQEVGDKKSKNDVKTLKYMLSESLYANFVQKWTNLGELGIVLKYIIRVKLPIESFEGVFTQLYNGIIAVSPDSSVDYKGRQFLFELYSENVRMALVESSYSDESKQKLINLYILIFNRIAQWLQDLSPPIEFVEAVCREYSNMHHVLLPYLSRVGANTFKDALRGLESFERKYIFYKYKNLKNSYSIDKWILDYQEVEKEHYND